VLLLALDDYFTSPSQDCLARLFDAINSMDISAAPALTRAEKLVMRSSERKDVFAEKFLPARPPADHPAISRLTHKPTQSNGSLSSFDDGILSRTQPLTRDRAGTEASIGSAGTSSSYTSGAPIPPPLPDKHSPSDNSFSLGGSAVWVGDESSLMEQAVYAVPSNNGGSSVAASNASRGRRSTDASSTSSHGAYQRPIMNPGSSDPHLRAGFGKDTHFFQTAIDYKGHQLPIKMPLSTFPEEVGDVSAVHGMCLWPMSLTAPSQYSVIQLIQALSIPPATVTGPLHPHLHTNGGLTHPIMILFNALVTGKRIVFLGYNKSAGTVCSYVLSACALGTGCGTVLRGFVDRAFPYANLTNRDDWEQMCGFRPLATMMVV
jgi:hypothetical protein